MTIDAVFKTRNLVAAVESMRPVPTPVLSKVFTTPLRSFSSNLEWDVEKDSEGVCTSIPSGSPAKVISKDGYDHVVVPAPRFSEKFHVKPSDLDNIRRMGDNVAPMLLADLVGREQAKLRAKIDRTREYMAVKALSGTVVDGSGVTLATFELPSGHNPSLTGINKWTDSESKIIENLRAWKKLISQACGGAVSSFHAFCGSAVMDAILNNPKVQELLKYTKGSQLAEQGTIAHLAGVDIEELLGSYKNDEGVRSDLIPAGYIALVGVGAGNAGEAFAPPEDFEAADGIGSGKLPGVFFSKSWEEKDPSVRWVKVEARPLPVILRPGCIVYAKVL